MSAAVGMRLTSPVTCPFFGVPDPPNPDERARQRMSSAGVGRPPAVGRVLAAASIAAGAALVLAGCVTGPDPAAQDRAAEVYDRLLGAMAETDPAVLRTVEEVPADPVACGADGWAQHPLLARATLSVQAEEGASDRLMDALAAELGEGWSPAPAATPGTRPPRGTRAWSSPDGVTVTLVDASPVISLAVFPPCAPPEAVAAD